MTSWPDFGFSNPNFSLKASGFICRAAAIPESGILTDEGIEPRMTSSGSLTSIKYASYNNKHATEAKLQNDAQGSVVPSVV